jgi:hypothetical protein
MKVQVTHSHAQKKTCKQLETVSLRANCSLRWDQERGFIIVTNRRKEIIRDSNSWRTWATIVTSRV